MTITDIVDPFADPDEIPTLAKKRNEIITGGRYRLPNRDGTHRKGGWQRITNLVGAYSDQFGLRMYEIEECVKGIACSPDLLEELLQAPFEEMSKGDRREWVADFLERCKEATRANQASKHGILRHAQVEAEHAGELPPAADPKARQDLSLYRSALIRNRLRALPGMQERRVLLSELGAVGTLDNILEDLVSGLFHIADLKTIKKFWTFLEIAAQLACYAHAEAMWESDNDPDEPRAGRWVDMPKVDLSIGLVLWMPRVPPGGEPMVDVYEVDIEAGWRTAQRAYEVVLDRAAAKTTTDPRGWKRAAPLVSETEKFAARFAAVSTVAEGSALVAEAKKAGVWSDVLADEARQARERILKTG